MPSCRSTRCRSAARPNRRIRSRFWASPGVKPEEILQDVADLWAARRALPQDERGGGGHVLTGPIYVEGAAPGDTLAVEMVELTTRVPYGINATSSTSGVFAPTYGADQAIRSMPGNPPGNDSSHPNRHGQRTAGRVLLRHDSRADESVHGHDGCRARTSDRGATGRQSRGPADLRAAGTLRRQHGLPRAEGRAPPCTCRSSTQARCSTSAIRTASRATARSAATLSSSR